MKGFLGRVSKVGYLAFVIASLTATAQAAPSVSGNFTAIDKLFKSDGSSAQSLGRDGETRIKLARPILIGGKTKRLGRFRIRFDTEKKMHITGGEDTFRLLQGTAKVAGKDGSDEVPVAGTITAYGKNSYVAQVNFLNEGIGRGVDPLDAIITIRFKLKRIADGTLEATIIKAPQHRRKDVPKRACGVTQAGPSHKLSASSHTRDVHTSAEFKTVSVFVEGDTDLAGQAEASNLPAYLADMMNTVDVWYMRDFGVSLNPTIESTPQSYSGTTGYNSEYEYYLHQEMRQLRPADSRTEYMHYLVTGKDNNDGLAGVVPDIGTICRDKDYSIGFTIFYPNSSTFNTETTAHEMGHLFAAEHDDGHTNASVAYLMFSGTSSRDSSVSEFSDYSKAQVSGFLDTNNSCLGNEVGDIPSDGDDDTPRLTTLQLTRTGRLKLYRGRLKVVAYDQFNKKIRRGLTANIYCGSAAEGPFATLLASKPIRAKVAKFALWYDDLGYDIFCQAESNGVLSEMIQVIQAPYFDEE